MAIPRLGRRLMHKVLPLAALAALAFSLLPVQQGAAYTELEVGCLALNIYYEARGESRSGQLAVASVTLNRVRSTRYPDNVCAVVWQPRQFSWTAMSIRQQPRHEAAWRSALVLATEAYRDPAGLPLKGVTHFHAREVRPYWVSHLRLVDEIGNHLFYAS